MNEARKHRDQPRTLLFSTTLADLKNREFELQHPLSDDEAAEVLRRGIKRRREAADRKSTRLNSSHSQISYAVFCLKKKKRNRTRHTHKQKIINKTNQIFDQTSCTNRGSHSLIDNWSELKKAFGTPAV